MTLKEALRKRTLNTDFMVREAWPKNKVLLLDSVLLGKDPNLYFSILEICNLEKTYLFVHDSDTRKSDNISVADMLADDWFLIGEELE